MASQVYHQVNHKLARAVIRHLATAIHQYHRDITGGQYVLGFAGLPLGVDPWVFQQPEFIGRGGVSRGRERFHRLPGFQVGLFTQVTNDQLGHQVTAPYEPGRWP